MNGMGAQEELRPENRGAEPRPRELPDKKPLRPADDDAGRGTGLGKSIPEGRPVWKGCSGLGTRPSGRPLGALPVGHRGRGQQREERWTDGKKIKLQKAGQQTDRSPERRNGAGGGGVRGEAAGAVWRPQLGVRMPDCISAAPGRP